MFGILQSVLRARGMAALICAAAAVIAIWAVEHACLLHIGLGTARHRPRTAGSALRRGIQDAIGVLLLSAQIAVRTFVWSAPFLAAAGLVYWTLLTDFDINYYLAQRPPAFWTAAILLALVLAALLVILLSKILSWYLAFPLLVFEDVSPTNAIRESVKRTTGDRCLIAALLALWITVNALLGAVNTGVIIGIGRLIVPRVAHSVALVAPVAGALFLFWAAGNLMVTLLQSGSLASMTTHIYLRRAPRGIDVPASDERAASDTSWRFASLRIWIVSLGGAVAGAAVVGTWLVSTVRLDDDVLVIAHRGAARAAPENTLAAVERAIVDGADMVEIDVQETADGEVVVFHDRDFMKAAGQNLKIWDATIEQLRGIDVGSHFSPEFSDQRVPRLGEVLELCKDRATVNIELKYYGHDQKLEERVANIVEEVGVESQIVVMSLEKAAVVKMKQLRPAWQVGLLYSAALGDPSRLTADFLAVNASAVHRAFVRQAHARGKDVYVWTVNEPVQMSRLVSMGVDGLITDEPRLARTVLRDRSRMGLVQRMLLELLFLVGGEPDRTAVAQ